MLHHGFNASGLRSHTVGVARRHESLIQQRSIRDDLLARLGGVEPGIPVPSPGAVRSRNREYSRLLQTREALGPIVTREMLDAMTMIRSREIAECSLDGPDRHVLTFARCRVHHHANAGTVGAGNEGIEPILLNSRPNLCDAVLVAPFAIDEDLCASEFDPVVAETRLQAEVQQGVHLQRMLQAPNAGAELDTQGQVSISIEFLINARAIGPTHELVDTRHAETTGFFAGLANGATQLVVFPGATPRKDPIDALVHHTGRFTGCRISAYFCPRSDFV